MKRWRWTFALWLCALAFVSATRGAHAHASLLESRPAIGALIARSPDQIILRFNESVTPLVFSLVTPDGVARPQRAAAAADNSIIVTLDGPLPDGSSLLNWRVVSADGHPVAGVLDFSISHPTRLVATQDARAANQPLAIAIWLLRVTLYGALFVGVGGAFFRQWIDPEPASGGGARLVARACLWAGLLASPILLILQGLDALGLPLTTLPSLTIWNAGWSTSLATSLVAADVACVLALVTLRAGAFVKTLALTALVAAAGSLILSGHASTARPVMLMQTMVFIHALGIIIWAGALPPLLVLSRGSPDRFISALRRFSNIAIPAVAAMGIAGFVLAWFQVQSVSALWTTEYGRVLLLKLVAVGLLIALAAVNRLWLTPAAAAKAPIAAPALRGAIGVEISLMAIIFGLVALWRFTPPPRALLLAQAQRTRLHIHTEKAMADIVLTRDANGQVHVEMRILAGDFRPLEPKEASVSLSQPETGVEPIERAAAPDAEGVWRAGPLSLPILPGEWTLRVDLLIDDFNKVSLQEKIVIPGLAQR